MKRLWRSFLVLAGGGLALYSGSLLVFMLATSPRLSEPGQPLASVVLAIGTVAGLGIVRRGDPGLPGRWLRAGQRAVAQLFGRWRLGHPVGLAAITMLVATLLMIPPVVHRFVIVFVALVAYIAASAIALLTLPRWWVPAILTLLTTLVVMFGLIYIAEAFERGVVGEGALALVGPLMLSWAVVPLTGLIRLVRRLRASRRAS